MPLLIHILREVAKQEQPGAPKLQTPEDVEKYCAATPEFKAMTRPQCSRAFKLAGIKFAATKKEFLSTLQAEFGTAEKV